MKLVGDTAQGAARPEPSEAAVAATADARLHPAASITAPDGGGGGGDQRQLAVGGAEAACRRRRRLAADGPRCSRAVRCQPATGT